MTGSISERRRKLTLSVLVAAITSGFLFSAAACSPDDAGVSPATENETDGVLTVFVNIPPQGRFVSRIGGDMVDMHVLVPPGRDPHVFTPTPREIARLGGADIYFHGIKPFGRKLAGRVERSGAAVRVVDISEGVELRDMQEHSHSHDHGEDHDTGHRHHHAEGKDPHIWLSPPEIKVQARNIADALKSEDPEHEDAYEENLQAFLADVESVHEQLTQILAPHRGRSFYVFHPAFGYFAGTYGLVQEAVETGGRSPSPKHLRRLITQALEDGVKVIFVQPQFESRSAKVIAEAIDGVVMPLNPLAEDVLENLLDMGRNIAKALGGAE